MRYNSNKIKQCNKTTRIICACFDASAVTVLCSENVVRRKCSVGATEVILQYRYIW